MPRFITLSALPTAPLLSTSAATVAPWAPAGEALAIGYRHENDRTEVADRCSGDAAMPVKPRLQQAGLYRGLTWTRAVRV